MIAATATAVVRDHLFIRKPRLETVMMLITLVCAGGTKPRKEEDR
jgi:hypothetical protein